MSSAPKESQNNFNPSSDSFMISLSLRFSMFSIKYLYSVRGNFAILYRGTDKKIIEETIKQAEMYKEQVNISIFVRPELLVEGLFNINDWIKMEHQFAKYYEITINPKK